VPARLVEVLPVGPLACNCSILVDEATREAVVLDPGDEPERILAALARAQARTTVLLHTHAHFDHVGATRRLHESTGSPTALHPADLFLYERLSEQGSLFGLSVEAAPVLDRRIADGERIRFGESDLAVLHTPGHTPGSCSFVLESAPPIVFSGDTLFRDSIGRTDLWGGSLPEIERSIRERLYVLPPQSRVVPGHGEETTIGREREANPFVRA
jgi:hydroxyacylglutathione hydrolase